MKIALLGYGKMGKVIERIALERGHEIVLKKDENNTFEGIETADVAIDFSVPMVAVENISAAFNAKVPVISGTTGWLDKFDDMAKLCYEQKTAFISTTNFSLGVNLFFQLNENLAKIMAHFASYKVSMEEIHHTQKLDAPSGTAITLAEGVIKNSNYTGWALDTAANNILPITAVREGEVPGTHTVSYASGIDTIEIKHTAHNREGFALGAVIAAEWIVGKEGIFSMRDVLNFE